MSESKPPRAPAPKDIAIVSGPTDDGQGAKVLRIREGDVSAGEIRPVRDGEPVNQSEVVRLHPLDPTQRVCAVEVLHAPAKPAKGAKDEPETRGSAGPARVSNARYRQNWSAIFEREGSKKGDSDWSVN
jgi:hypothetical protein